MTHLQRGMAALADQPVDRLCSYPLAIGVNRNLLPRHVTYPEWANNPKNFADSFVLAQQYYGFDFAIGLMDLSVMAADLGSHVRMDAENTLLAGVIDPQLFIRGTPEQMDGVVKDLYQEVKTALCNKGLHSRWVISSNCEVPPDEVTKKECIKAAVDATVKCRAFRR